LSFNYGQELSFLESRYANVGSELAGALAPDLPEIDFDNQSSGHCAATYPGHTLHA